MTGAFGPLADFSGIDGTSELCISDVIQKAFIEAFLLLTFNSNKSVISSAKGE